MIEGFVKGVLVCQPVDEERRESRAGKERMEEPNPRLIERICTKCSLPETT